MGERSTLYCQGEELVLLGMKLVLPVNTASLIFKELAIPGQTATGKESSNPFMAEFKDLSTAAERFFEDASKQGRIHDAYATVTKEQKVDDDKETTQEVRKCLDTSS
ncbi:hypothetical protein Tco_0619664, partial [Tanacetum coccineum]